MNDFREIFNRLKLIYGVSTDKKIAEKLEINYNTVKTWSSRGKIPIETLLESIHDETINLNWLLTGKGSMHLQDDIHVADISHNHNSGIIVSNNSGNISVSINKDDFKDNSADIEELISLLRYAPKSFILKINEKLRAFRDLSQI